jgi:transcriptional regulator with XRE-family HTH domain
MTDKNARDKRRGRLLQALREEAGLEQKDVAELMDVSRVTVSRWETGATEVKRSAVRELVMLYMSKGATPDPAEAAAAEIEIPRRTADRPAGTSAYATPETIKIPQDILRSAMEQTEAHLLRLSEISGYAKHVLEMMQHVTAGQARVVESLAPWVRHEEKAYAVDPQMLEDATADVMRDAARVSAEQAASPRRRKQKSGGK